VNIAQQDITNRTIDPHCVCPVCPVLQKQVSGNQVVLNVKLIILPMCKN
jgi:hypothetical protein